MINELKFHIEKSTDPYHNIAVEKYLFDSNKSNCSTLYLWQNKNTVVIGQNQNPWSECRCSLLNKEGGKIARRLSGGGSVYHDTGNLNFTFISSSENQDISKNTQIIKSACETAGIKCEVSGRNDLLADGRKFSGNAFYNSNGKSYHHGTLLISSDLEKLGRYLTPDADKLKAKGIKSVKSRVVNLNELSSDLTTEAMKDFMLASFESAYRLTASEITKIPNNAISENIKLYQSWDYIYGKTMPFNLSYRHRFKHEDIQLLLNVEKGEISSVQVYTDSLDTKLSDKISSTLNGCRFNKDCLCNAILSNGLGTELAEFFNKLDI